MGELADPGKRSSNLVKWADEVGRGLVKIKCFNVEDEATSLTAGKYQICDHLDGGGNGEQKKGKKFEVGETSRSRDDEGRQEALTSCRRVTAWDRVGKEKKIHKRIERADEVGRDLLKTIRSNEDDEGTIPASGKGNNREPNEITNDGQLQSKSQGVPGRQRCGERKWGEGGSTNCSSVNRGSFKDVLLRRLTPISSATNPQLPYPHSPPSQSTRRRTPPHRPVKRCYRCLASDHTVATCRDPVRCYRACSSGQGFVPYTDEYFRRVELRRNAILADVIQPANLGPDPISTIKTALASRFGGYKEDFAVARSRERHFVIFLPEWVPAAVLIRREVLTLNDFWIRCWPWGRYRDARPHRVQYKAWIRLINLPFEIWSVARVASLISGFGRFIKADDETKALTDFRAFRCQIALDSINNIPQNLSVIIGEELFPVMVHLERWERTVEGGAAAPPAPPRNGGDNAEEGADNQNQARHADREHAQDDDDMADAPGELEEVESHPRTHRALGTMSATRTSSTNHQFGAAEGLRAALGRRRWLQRVGEARTSTRLGGLTRKKECIHARDGELEAAFTPLGQLSGLEPKKLTLASKLSGLEPKKLTLASWWPSPLTLSLQISLGTQLRAPLVLAHGSARSLSLGHPGLLHMTYGSAFLMYGGSIGRPASLSSVCFSKEPEELSICFSEELEEPRPTTISPFLRVDRGDLTALRCQHRATPSPAGRPGHLPTPLNRLRGRPGRDWGPTRSGSALFLSSSSTGTTQQFWICPLLVLILRKVNNAAVPGGIIDREKVKIFDVENEKVNLECKICLVSIQLFILCLLIKQ
uniref:Uncharacterized protein n=1 Tax=Ananas comosus var. bracteatus TaxID=296719 RepID=A0A6V7QMK2_ANACO|nr:unnamed protein product [Ananas comosus var. bracteatus]